MRIKIFVWGLLLSMGIAVGIDQSDRFQAPAASWLYPGLLENLTTVTAVRISQASEGVDLVFKNGQWSVAQRFNYPLNQKQLSKVLNQLSQARLVEKKTAMAKNHADLGLQAGLDGPAPMITLQLDQVLEPVLIGHQATARQATFVRYPTNDQVWLIDKAVEVSAAPADWLDRSLLNLTDAMIEQIDISQSAGAALTSTALSISQT